MATAVNPKRITRARLAKNMSRADLAYAIRQASRNEIKASERGVAGWERGEYRPSDGVVPAIAEATGQEIGFFYEPDSDDEEEDPAALLRDLAHLPSDLQRRLRRMIDRVPS